MKKIRPQTERFGGDVDGNCVLQRNNASHAGTGHQGHQQPKAEKVTEHHRGGHAKQ